MDKVKFAYEIVTADWDFVYREQDTEFAWIGFKQKFVDILDKHAPYKHFNSRKDRQPWVTTEFLETGNERDEKQKIASITLVANDKREYKRVRNWVTALKRELKRLFFRNSIDEAEGDQRKLWKALKHFLQNSSPSNRILTINGETDAEKMASAINNYFAEIGVNLSEKIGNSQIVLDYTPKPNVPFLVLYPTTVENVEKYLMKIPDSKATGDDGIPIRFIKLTKSVTAKLICHIINRTIATSIIPQDWKNANITPLFKEGDRGVQLIIGQFLYYLPSLKYWNV